MGMVEGRVYNAELRSELIQFGLRRIAAMQWVSKETATKYELLLSDEDSKIVTGVDILDANRRIHIAVNETVEETAPVPQAPLNLHHKTMTAIMRQLDISDYYFDLMDRWNDEMMRETPLGNQLRTACKMDNIVWDNFLFLPDPTASGEYMFATFRKGKAASMHAWLQMPDDKYIVPTDGTDEAAYDSLLSGLEFHRWEFDTFDTPAAAGQFAIKLLNNSNTTYAQAIRRLLGKEEGKITRNDFYRNSQNQMCRIEVIRDENGLRITDVPTLPTLADSIDSLLAPFIKLRALNEE